MGFLHHKVASRSQIQPDLAKKRPAKMTPKIARSALPGGLTAVTLTQEGVPAPHSGPPITKIGVKWQKIPKITPQIARSTLLGDPPAVTLATNHSIFIKRP